MGKILISLVLLMFMNISTVFAFEGSDFNMCAFAADPVEEDCSETAGENSEDIQACLLNGMDVQGFVHKKDFYIDSDNTIFCITADMFPFLELPSEL